MILESGLGIMQITDELEKKFNWDIDEDNNFIFNLEKGQVVLFSMGHPSMDGTRGHCESAVLEELAQCNIPFWVAEEGTAPADVSKWNNLLDIGGSKNV